jgi:hypothetical protein
MAKRLTRWVLGSAAAIAVVWITLTAWVQMKGPAALIHFPAKNSSGRVLIVYDPDPIYNFDLQLCTSIAEGLNDRNIGATVATVRSAETLDVTSYNGVVLCANTYNWAPDASVTTFARSNEKLGTIPVVAVTIGSGSTAASAKKLRRVLESRKIKLISEHEWWLMRPNDESGVTGSNLEVAKDQAFKFGQQMASEF